MKNQGPPAIRFDAKKGQTWLELPSKRWLALEKSDVKRHFQLAGFPVNDFHYSGMTQFEHAMVICQRDLCVDYAGPLGGHRTGIYNCSDGKKILVTSEPKFIPAVEGESPRFDKFILELFGPEQATFFLLWLKVARDSLVRGDFRPGQMLSLAGPSGCGKSLLQSIITEFLGGRAAKPYLYMTGQTAFNSHLAGSEHLIIADEQASLDLRSRRNFGAAIKDLTVNLEMNVHAKGRDIAVCVPTFRRLSLSVNHEPENLAIHPPADDSILDKIAFLKCSPADVGPDRKKVWSEFMAELPAVAWQLERMRIPRSMADTRYGVRAYHNPEILEIVADISPENRLLSLIDDVIFEKRSGESHQKYKDRIAAGWSGSAIELERELRQSSFAFAVDKLLSFAGAAGTYLSRLKTKYPDRITAARSRGKTVWTIGTPD